MADARPGEHPRRVYALSPKELTEEQLAVVCAMTSRRPEPFDEIAQQVTQERAADFHERWVLGYGHASVAEHAVIHMAVENISRLACDALEDNRLASYTEKSSRYQVIDQGSYHVPQELQDHPELLDLYKRTCDGLFQAYQEMTDAVAERLQQESGMTPQRAQRTAIDSCRFLLPTATLTNVGVTMNARVMEHAVSKLLSSELFEEHELGELLKEKGREITPTLIKYADENSHLKVSSKALRSHRDLIESSAEAPDTSVRLLHYDPDAERKLTAALLYRSARSPYADVWAAVERMSEADMEQVLDSSFEEFGPHDAPVRELETVDYSFELVLDYGAYREFKRHRMQTYLPQPLSVDNGFLMPRRIREAALESQFAEAMNMASESFHRVHESLPHVAPYLVTHAHYRRVLTKMNLRECYHLFKLRTQPTAHFSIRRPIEQAMKLAVEVHPRLFKHLKLRRFPDWWESFYPESSGSRPAPE